MEFVGGPPVSGTPPPEQPVWFGPPEDVVGAIVPVGRIVAQRRDLGLVLTHAAVYPTGCQLHLQFLVRCDDAYARVMGQPHGQHGLPHSDSDELHFELRYPDGSAGSTRRFAVAEVVDHVRTGQSPQQPLLMNSGGSSAGDDKRVRGDRCVWIYPLLPPQVCVLSVEWARVGIPPTSIEIDGAELVTAAGRTHPLLG